SDLIVLLLNEHKLDEADALLTEGLALATRQNISRDIAALHTERSLWHWFQGRYIEAVPWAEKAMDTIARLPEDMYHDGNKLALLALGCAHCGIGDFAQAKPLLLQALPLLVPGGYPIPACLAGIAAVLGHEDQPERALEIISLVGHHRLTPAWWLEDEPLTRRLLQDLQQTLAPDTYAAAWERGKSLDMEHVIEELRAELAPPKTA
ncbi:MAG: tetratricopeptide repeat protein, partial [Anaerolineae bacterium]|nr:tetratricopeptide repeat protein [Anaerolineae bacterium]